ncbi:DUF58 domain-containing protein [Roseibium litorale]|uniref:DUF58 domain-containing protein n=1 Tax=Roseibium litorale TaxID=2803841 RepID=A0ABR9CTW9_9HYPH|nr:DUF58 domain-containing protein [Roseibium litorale]MBD8894074.1 DUF58 domain-containing protein [Roseibium litorale]
MVSAVLDHPGIRFSAGDLLALRQPENARERHRPATRRPGAVPAKLPGSGMDLREIRAYFEGDDTRRIDPAATARTGRPHVRSFHEDRDNTALLIADFRPAMLWGTSSSLRSVRAARLLARRGWDAIDQGASVGVLAMTSSGISSLPARGGVRQMSAIAQLLAHEHDKALERREGSCPLSAALVHAGKLAPAGARVWLATGTQGIAEEDEAALRRLSRRRQVILLCPLDLAETAPPSRALPVQCGPSRRFARLRPLETAPLEARMRALNVTLEALEDDAG